MKDKKEHIEKWNEKCSNVLVGKTIKEVRYMTDKELEECGWFKRVLVIFFTDGTYMFPSMDDEGNDGGALFTNFDGLTTIPVIHNH